MMLYTNSPAVYMLVDRAVLSEELPVSQCHSAGSVHPQHILIKLSDLSFVPFGWVGTSLVMDLDSVTYH